MDGIERTPGVRDTEAWVNNLLRDRPGPSPSVTRGSAAIRAGLASFGASAVSATGDFLAGEHTISVTRSGRDLVVSLDGGAGVVVSGGSPVILRGSKGTLTITFCEVPEAKATEAGSGGAASGGGTLQALERLGVTIKDRPTPQG
jgi:hypothetical protein